VFCPQRYLPGIASTRFACTARDIRTNRAAQHDVAVFERYGRSVITRGSRPAQMELASWDRHACDRHSGPSIRRHRKRLKKRDRRGKMGTATQSDEANG
jgi:hypothetical protein